MSFVNTSFSTGGFSNLQIAQAKERIQTISQTSPEEAIPFLDNLANDSNLYIRKTAAEAIGEYIYPDSDAIRLLMKLLEDSRAEVREAATISWMNRGGNYIVLEQMTRDKSKRVPRTMSKMLSSMQATSPAESLYLNAKLVRNNDPITASTALSNLKKFRSVPFGDIADIASGMVKGAEKYHPTLYKICTPISREGKLKVQKHQEMGTPKPQFISIVKQAQSKIEKEMPPHLQGWLSAMIEPNNEVQEDYFNFISCLAGYKYLYSVTISRKEKMGAEVLNNLPEGITGEVQVALLSDNDKYLLVEEPRVKELNINQEGESEIKHFTLIGKRKGQVRLQILVYYRGYLIIREYSSPINIDSVPGKKRTDVPRNELPSYPVMDHEDNITAIAKNMKQDRFANLLIHKENSNKLLFALFFRDNNGFHLLTARVPAEKVNPEFVILRERLENLTKNFQNNLNMNQSAGQKALEILREAGLSLWGDIFMSNELEKIRIKIIDLIKNNNTSSILQIVSNEIFVPWQLMYVDDGEDDPKPEQFWGMRFQIEHTRAEGSGLRTWRIPQGNKPVIAFINRHLPRQTIQDHKSIFPNKDQRKYKEEEVIDEFRLENNECPAFYFYCHAEFNSKGKDKCWLELTDEKKRLTLAELRLTNSDPQGKQIIFKDAPLIFLNACESGQIESRFYQSFVGFLLDDKKAGGVIGTETKMPAFFATDFAKSFWKQTQSKPIGEVLLELRKSYWKHYHNPLGLLYSLYANAERKI